MRLFPALLLFPLGIAGAGAPRPGIDRHRMKVDLIQNVDTAAYPPSQKWMSDKDNTGEGIWIGIYDEPIDTSLRDFRELDSNGVSRFRGAPNWDPFYGRDHCCLHGTHVAGIAGGNGAASESSGGSRYQYRG